MAFVPASSIAPATVTVSGSVAVSNFPASQAVTGPLTDAQLAARLPLGVSVGNFPADQLVHFVTPISVTQGTSPWVVDGSAVTQPVSAASLPLPTGAATEETLDAAKDALNDVALTGDP